MNTPNGIVGDNNPFEIPRTEMPDELFEEMKKKAKFSKTEEFKLLKRHIEGRIDFFQKNLPGGQPIGGVDPKVLGPMWVASDTIIKELMAIVGFYENAAEQVKQANAATK